MKDVRVKLDIGHWDQAERSAVTVSVSVRQEKGDQQYFSGVGASVCAPEDDGPDVWNPAAGERLALERALRDSKMPFVYADAVRRVWKEEGRLSFALNERKLGEEYRRITRRIGLRSGKELFESQGCAISSTRSRRLRNGTLAPRPLTPYRHS